MSTNQSDTIAALAVGLTKDGLEITVMFEDHTIFQHVIPLEILSTIFANFIDDIRKEIP